MNEWIILKIAAEYKPYHIDLFEDTLYITTYHSNRILKMNKFGKGNHTDITQGLMNAADVVIIQSKKQRRSRHLQNLTQFQLCLIVCMLIFQMRIHATGLRAHHPGFA